jgi:cellulose synthase/poly-beta-1,6-N-acetylglucosamine synthase-like glycosyltransferase
MLLFISGVVYLGLLVFCFYNWNRMGDEVISKNISQHPMRFSIIIPARNEADVITACLDSIINQHYPTDSFEIIVADDHSNDNTAKIAETYASEHKEISIRALRIGEIKSVKGAYKKEAIAESIKHAEYEWIITTDADCLQGSEWLSSLNDFILTCDPVMVCGPVCLEDNNSLFQRIQALEFAGLMGTAGASLEGGFPMTCNGANLAYSKKAFYDVGEFTGIDKFNSGDDEMLMMKMHKKWPGKVRFLKNQKSIVYTDPQPTLNSFLQQRKRWVSKSTSHGIWHSLVLLFVYLYHALIIIGLITSFFIPEILIPTLIAIVSKALIEWPFLYRVCTFLGKPKLAFLYPLALIPQTFYVFFIGIYGNLGAYKWKGRTLR